MTHSGGKPHNVGDKGQRYEVSFLDGEDGRQVLGWCTTIVAARQLVAGIEKHPVWHTPSVFDRESKVLVAL